METTVKPTLHGRLALKYRLSKSEIDIWEMVARGMTTDQIADKRFTSPKTVKNQLHSLYKGIGVDNRIQAAVLYAKEAGL